MKDIKREISERGNCKLVRRQEELTDINPDSETKASGVTMAYLWSPSMVTLSEAGFTLSATEQGAPLFNKVAGMYRNVHPPQIHLLFKVKFQLPHKKLTLATQSNWQHSVELYILNPKSQVGHFLLCDLGQVT